ncbi:MAG: hypothetical protein EBU40_16845, partial [Proteobacteria bacterium]|nr:hypothetical protein [Pseudomonadota bacterium]
MQNRTSSVTVSVVLGPNTNFKRATFDLSYATSEINIIGCVPNSSIVTGTCTDQGSGNYLVSLTTSSASGQTGTVQVLTLSLRGLVVGTSNITFSNLAFTNAAGAALTVSTTQQLNL